MVTTDPRHPRWAAPSLVLFLALFAAQSSLLVMTPILPAVADEFGVTISAAAQLRSVTGLVAGCVAVWLAVRSEARPLRDLLVAGLVLLTVGSVTSAAAPSMAVLVVAQLGVGVGLGILLPTALAAAGTWEPERERTVLAWERDEVALAPPDEPPMWREPGTRGWALGELLGYGGWSGTLVFVGALLVHGYATSITCVGLVLAVAAAAYVPGNFLARRWAYTHLRGTLDATADTPATATGQGPVRS